MILVFRTKLLFRRGGFYEVEFFTPMIIHAYAPLFMIIHGYPRFHAHCHPIPIPNRKNQHSLLPMNVGL